MTQTLELIDKNIVSYFTCIPYVQEARQKILHLLSRDIEDMCLKSNFYP